MKLKTVKSAKKRLIKTGSGKLLRRKISVQHLARRKSKRTRKSAGKKIQASSADTRKVKKLVPYQ